MFILYRVLVSIKCWFLRLSPLERFGFRFVCGISRSPFLSHVWQAISWYLFALQSEEYASRGCTFARFLEICFLANFFTTWVKDGAVLGSVIRPKRLKTFTLPATNSLQLKMDGWKISYPFLVWFPCQVWFPGKCELLVSESVIWFYHETHIQKMQYWLDGWCTSWPSQSFLPSLK